MHQDDSDHTAVAMTVMYIIAITLVVCSAGVLAFKGINAMPFKVYGVIGAAIFVVAALAMAQYAKRQAH